MNEWIQIEEGGCWTAVRARPRCEKKIAEFARVHGIRHYLPLLRRRRRYQRRRVESMIPMFPGYLFAQINAESLPRLLQCQKIVRVLRVTDRQERQLVRELNDIRIIELAELEKDLEVNPELVPGINVLIASGPLQGCHGIVERRDQRTRITVNLNLLGSSVSAHLDLTEIDIEVNE